jgi:hypothetical protein
MSSDDVWTMTCRCGTPPEPHEVVGDFFALPREQQDAYVDHAAEFIRQAYLRLYS